MSDLQGITPQQVTVEFHAQNGASVHTETVLLSTLNIPEFNGVGGNDFEKLFHDTATYDIGVGNLTEIQNLAQQIARDYYSYLLSPLDIKYGNILGWKMEGLSDCVEWTYRLDEVSTRIQRGPWNDLVEELSHLSSIVPTMMVSGTLTVTDDNNDVMNVQLIDLHAVDGFLVGSTGPNIATVNLLSASAAQRGIVALADQQLGTGNKGFASSLYVTSSHGLIWANSFLGAQLATQLWFGVTSPHGSSVWQVELDHIGDSLAGPAILTWNMNNTAAWLDLHSLDVTPFFQITDSRGSHPGVSGSFTSLEGESIAVVGGIVTSIVGPFAAQQGDLLYYDGTEWTTLTPGVLGQTLVTGGAAANPFWGRDLIPVRRSWLGL